MEWQPIETAPKDGTPVWVRRIWEGRTIAEGLAVFDLLGDTATARKAKALFHITWPGTLQESLPSEGFEFFTISENF